MRGRRWQATGTGGSDGLLLACAVGAARGGEGGAETRHAVPRVLASPLAAVVVGGGGEKGEAPSTALTRDAIRWRLPSPACGGSTARGVANSICCAPKYQKQIIK